MTDTLKHDPLTETLYGTITAGIAEIAKINEVLLSDESGTPVREIDKILKDEKSEVPKSVRTLWEKAEKARKQYRELVEQARNGYRTEVLGEEAKDVSSVSDEDKEAAKEKRAVVMGSLQFLKTYADGNGMADVAAWADSVSVPQVGRQGSSSVGAKKPRVFVKNGETVYGSFTEAAKGLSDDENKYTAADVAEAWNKAGGVEGNFDFNGTTLNVTYKPKKSEQAAA